MDHLAHKPPEPPTGPAVQKRSKRAVGPLNLFACNDLSLVVQADLGKAGVNVS